MDYAKRNPGVTFAGTGGVVRLAPVLFAQRTGIQLEYVPYRGSTQAHPDLIANRVNIMFDTVPAALPHIQSGALKFDGDPTAIGEMFAALDKPEMTFNVVTP